jgi:hypothetical protein
MEGVWQFGTPEKQSNGSEYIVPIANKPFYSYRLMWNGHSVEPELAMQSSVLGMRDSVLKAVSENKAMFRQPPTLKSLQALASQWGVIVQNGAVTWGTNNVWNISATSSILENRKAYVNLTLASLIISRSAIRAVWNVEWQEYITDAPQIDIDFDVGDTEDGGDVQSVGSMDIESDGTEVVPLQDLVKKRRDAKQNVRELLRLSRQAKLAAEDALDRFYNEFDLSDDESEFSEDESSDEGGL